MSVLPMEPITFSNQVEYQNDVKNYYRLREAVKHKNKILIQQLTAGGTPVNVKIAGPLIHTPLHLAVISRSPEIVKVLLDNGADINAECHSGDTPLTMAAKMENTLVTDLLLSYNIKNYENQEGLSHLHVACMRNRVDVVKKLLLMKQGENINESVNENSVLYAGYTPLHFAVRFGCIETVEFLLHCKADIMIKDTKTMTPLHLADFLRNERIIDLILTAHPRYKLSNPANSHGLTHFHVACTRDNPFVVELFLKKQLCEVNRGVELSPWKGWKSIHFAIFYECPTVIEILMKSTVTFKDPCFNLLMKNAFLTSKETIYKLVLANRSDRVLSELKYQKFSSPLETACRKGDAQKIATLISQETTDVNGEFGVSSISSGFTPLNLAVRYGSEAATRCLLNLGADVMKQNSEGKTPIHIAFESKVTEIFDLLLDSLVSQPHNATDNVGFSLLHILCTTNRVKMIEGLLIKGANVNAQVGIESPFWAGFSPLHLAVRFYQLEVADMLLAYDADVLLKNGLGLSPLDMILADLTVDDHIAATKYTLAKMLSSIYSSPYSMKKILSNQGPSLLHALAMMCQLESKELLTHLRTNVTKINETVELRGSQTFNRCTSLHLAMRFAHFKQARVILNNGADPNIMNNDRETPLECAFSHRLPHAGPLDDCENLFLHTLVRSSKDFKPSHFHLACALGFTPVIQFVFDNIIDERLKESFVNCLNDANQTSLHVLFLHGKPQTTSKEIVQLFMDNGANVNARDYQLQTPLHYALTCGPDVVRLLIDYGADVRAQNILGQTPLVKFCKDSLESNDRDSFDFDKFHEVIVILLEKGSDIEVADYSSGGCMYYLSVHLSRFCIEQRRLNTPKFFWDHFMKLKVLGFNMHKVEKNIVQVYPNLNYNSDDRLNAFVNVCKKELDSMTSVNIDCHTTLRDILVKNFSKIVQHCTNVNLQKIIASNDLNTKYPVYANLLRLRVKRGKDRSPLLGPCRKSLMILVKNSLPLDCIEEVITYLDNIDLKNIISSTQRNSS